MKKIKIITLLLSITVLCSCANSRFYRSIFVDPQVKEMVNKILNKEVTLKELEIQNLEYEGTKFNRNKKDYSNIKGNLRLQQIIDSLTDEDIHSKYYKLSVNNADKNDFFYECNITYSKNNTLNYFLLFFRKLDDDDYHLVAAQIPPKDSKIKRWKYE